MANTIIHMQKNCKRCKTKINSYSAMRKWCVDCRKAISLEQAKARKKGLTWTLIPSNRKISTIA